MINYFKRHLFWKFFFSYFTLILIVMVILGVTLRILLPGIFDSHLVKMTVLFSRYGMEDMEGMMGGRNPMMMTMPNLFSDLYTIFYQILIEAIFYAVLTSIVIALGVSAVMSQRLVNPLQQMTKAADRIAKGKYKERLPIKNPSSGSRDELEQLATRFNHMTTKLEQLENLRIQLIGDVAHELRTPLTVIKGSMEGLVDGVLQPDDSTFKMIYRQADRLDRLVNDLQELNNIETGMLHLNYVAININVALKKVIQIMQINFSNKGVDLNLQPSEGEVVVMADEDRLEQIVINLLSNALRYTPQGGRVWVKVEKISDMVRVSVGDTGVGIPEKDLELIFSRFYRVDDARSRHNGGNGIGLTIAKKLVEAQNGKIWAESAGINKGAVFRFTIPEA